MVFGALFHLAWLVVFAALIGQWRIWSTCHGQGDHYLVITGGLMTVLFFSLCLEVAMLWVGFKGARRPPSWGLAPQSCAAEPARVLAGGALRLRCVPHCEHADVRPRAGAPLQLSKRKSMIPMLYALTFLWALQVIIMSAPTAPCRWGLAAGPG